MTLSYCNSTREILDYIYICIDRLQLSDFWFQQHSQSSKALRMWLRRQVQLGSAAAQQLPTSARSAQPSSPRLASYVLSWGNMGAPWGHHGGHKSRRFQTCQHGITCNMLDLFGTDWYRLVPCTSTVLNLWDRFKTSRGHVDSKSIDWVLVWWLTLQCGSGRTWRPSRWGSTCPPRIRRMKRWCCHFFTFLLPLRHYVPCVWVQAG